MYTWREDEEEDWAATEWPWGNEKILDIERENIRSRPRFGRGCGLVIRQTAWWWNDRDIWANLQVVVRIRFTSSDRSGLWQAVTELERWGIIVV